MSPVGYAPPSQAARLTIEGTGLSRFRVRSSDGWLAAFPPEWHQHDDGVVLLSVSATNAALEAGTHFGTLTVSQGLETEPDGVVPYRDVATIHVTHAVIPASAGDSEASGR